MNTKSYLDRFTFKVFQFAESKCGLQANDKIIVSVSGGVDSVSLLCLLDSFRQKIPLELHIVHFHHGLRKESDHEEEFVKDLASRKKIECTVFRSDQFKDNKGMQVKAREWRIDKLINCKDRLSFDKIATGHHLDDFVETQIWKLVRGTSLFSLQPLLPNNPPYIRPLLDTPKTDLKDYLERIKQDWCEDVSNTSNDYTRNMIRNEIIPRLDKYSGGKLLEKFSAIGQESQYLNSLFEELISSDIFECSSLAYQSVVENNSLLAKEIIHRFLLYNGQQEINRDNIERIYELVLSGRGNWSLDLKEGIKVEGAKKKIRVVPGIQS